MIKHPYKERDLDRKATYFGQKLENNCIALEGDYINVVNSNVQK